MTVDISRSLRHSNPVVSLGEQGHVFCICERQRSRLATIRFYAPNFEEVSEAYWLVPVRLSVCGLRLHSVKNP